MMSDTVARVNSLVTHYLIFGNTLDLCSHKVSWLQWRCG